MNWGWGGVGSINIIHSFESKQKISNPIFFRTAGIKIAELKTKLIFPTGVILKPCNTDLDRL